MQSFLAMALTSKHQLDKYKAKRDFKKTKEPAGKVKQSKSAQLTYMIQKHAATRLHYDFRLEWKGVLKSWAVTKGPSLDPGQKRLAVHVEDHPIEYATFEGAIPKGQYGGGTVMLWDEGSWEPLEQDVDRALQKGRLTFRLSGKRLKGEWHLVRMGKPAENGKENWLLMKSHDNFANDTNPFFVTEKYMTSVTTNRTMEKIASDNDVWQSNRAEKKTAKPKEIVPKKSASKKVVALEKPKALSKLNGKKEALPEFINVELATLVEEPPSGPNWVHEFKFDGYRALVRIKNGKAKMITRANNDWTGKFLDLPKEFEELKIKDALLDGEVVAVDVAGTMSFHTLQNSLGRMGNRIHNKEAFDDVLEYYAFDLLHLNGQSLRSLPLLERKKYLRQLIPADHPRIHFSEHFDAPGKEVLRNVCKLKMEGIVSKRSDSSYQSGRGKDWLKSKCLNEQEFVIVGYTYQTEHQNVLGALLVGYYEGETLKLAGKVGTGFTQDEAQDLLQRLETLRIPKPVIAPIPAKYRRANWVEPKLVAQIIFGEWTSDGMLRHASYQGLREDKPALQVKREERQKLSQAEPKENSKAKKSKISTEITSQKGNMSIRGITLSHPDKILYPDDKITKLDIAEYYDRVADIMLPHINNYPISLMRCNEGIGPSCFFQRHEEGEPDLLKKVPIKLNEMTREYIVLDTPEAIIELAQLNALEIHAWGAKAKTPDKPDKVIFDFDPDEGLPFERVKDAALEMRDRLKKLGLISFLKTTGGKGLHVVVPFTPGPDWDAVKGFSQAMAFLMTEDSPKLYLANMNKAKRKDKIYIDYHRNGKSATAVAPYSTRARKSAPIAMPLEWGELKKLKAPNLVTIRNFPKKFSDPWQDIMKIQQKLKITN